MFEDARAYDPQASPAQLYYITAAWDDPDRVPSSFLVGNGSKTVVDGTTYENTNLRSDTSYAVLFRIDIRSDTNEVMLIDIISHFIVKLNNEYIFLFFYTH